MKTIITFLTFFLSYYNKGNYDSAVADFEKALIVSPDFKPAKEYLELFRKKIQEL